MLGLLSVAVNHSHMNALWASTGKRIRIRNRKERRPNCLAFPAHQRDESGAPEGARKADQAMTTQTETQDTAAVVAEAGAPVTPQKIAAKKVASRNQRSPK